MQPFSKKTHCTDDMNAVDGPMAAESPVHEHESPKTAYTLDSIICVDMAKLRSASKYESKLDIRLTILIINEENPFQSKSIYHSIVLTSSNRKQKEPLFVPREDLIEDISFLDIVY